MREMKDSGVEWIGEIPKDWKILQVKYLFYIGRGRVIAQGELEDDGKYPVFSSQTKNNGCLGFINTFDFDIDQLTWTTDGANAGTVFLRSGKHNCTNVCGTLKPIERVIDLKYQKYVLEHIAYYHKRADTNGYKIMNNEMAVIKTILPLLQDQHRIADYLDTKCTKIDAIIDREHNVIEKLKEYKLSLITEAVTKGLNPDVPMKDSGVEWIGEMPEGWKLRKLNSITKKIIDGTHNTPNYQIDGIPFLRVTDITSSDGINRNIDWDNTAYISIDEHIELAKRCNPQKGDLLVSKNGTIGVPKIINWENVFSIFVSLCLIKVLNIIKVEYLYYYFKSSLIWTEIAIGGRTGTITNLHLEKIKEFKIPLPPISEQTQIADYLENKCNGIDSAIAKKQLVIDKLIEYKKSLIYEVVTGKKEV